MKFTRVSVAIVTYNRPQSLKKCLLFLTKQTCQPYEVVIVDSSDNDKSKKIAQSFVGQLPIKYLFEPQRGIGAARNKAMQSVKGDILCCIDDDCFADSKWIEEMVLAHRKHPNALCIQGKCFIVPQKGIISTVGQNDYDRWMSLNIDNNSRVWTLDMENSSFKIKRLKSLDIAYDNSFTKFYYCEDIDFGFTLLIGGNVIVYHSKAIVYSQRREWVFSYLKQRFLKGVGHGLIENRWKYVMKDGQFDSKKTLEKQKELSALEYKKKQIGIFEFLPTFIFMKLNRVVFKAGYLYLKLNTLFEFTKLDCKEKLGKKKMVIKDIKLSIMIITKDRMDSLINTLESLKTQTKKPYEVIIVDSSEIPLEEFIETYKDLLPIRYMYQPQSGFGIARNSAMRLAKGDVVATIDDDAIAAHSWCEEIITIHKQNPSVVAVQGKIICSPSYSLIAFVEQLRLDRWFLNSLDGRGNVKAISTKNASFKKAVLKKLGISFTKNPFLGMYGGEDVQIERQISSFGRPILYGPSIIVYHNERRNLFSYLSQQYRKGHARGFLEYGKVYKRKREKIASHIGAFFEVLDLVFHPLARKNPLIAFFSFPIYCMALYVYRQGMRNMDRQFKKNL